MINERELAVAITNLLMLQASLLAAGGSAFTAAVPAAAADETC